MAACWFPKTATTRSTASVIKASEICHRCSDGERGRGPDAAAVFARLHLKLPAKLVCVTCHSSVQSSTRAEDNNLPPIAICLGCHKQNDVRIGQPRPTPLARFNQQQPLALGNVAPVIRGAIDSTSYLSPVGD